MALMPQRLAERDGGVNPSECPNSNRKVVYANCGIPEFAGTRLVPIRPVSPSNLEALGRQVG